MKTKKMGCGCAERREKIRSSARRYSAAALSVRVAAEALLGVMVKWNFDPDQPRVPKGNHRESGRWTANGGEVEGASNETILAMASPRLEAKCLAQFDSDTFHCTMVGLASCHRQAMERYANCLAKRQIPPLNY
jgi:hypothetical protein